LATVEHSFQYRGDLSQTALPEILYTIHRFQVPGVIEATRDGVMKRVYIKEGNVVHASSSDREDSLGNHLLRSGALTPEVFAETMRERERLQKRYGVLLIERGILSPAEIYRAIRQQIEEVVWSLFYWQDGAVIFSIGDFREPDSVRIQLPMRQVILQGIKRAPNAKALAARLGRKETVFEPCYRMEDLIEAALDGAEYRLLSLVDGQRTLFDVCTQGPHAAADNAKAMYAFQVLQLIRPVPVAEKSPPSEPGPKREESAGAIKIRFKTTGDRYGG
jgi:two-component system, OmpR family, response regulator